MRSRVILVAIALALGSFLPAQSEGIADPMALIHDADARFDRWSEPFDFDAYDDRLGDAIALWEEALTSLPDSNVQSRSHVLNRLSQAYFELAQGYLTTSDDRERAYGRGRDAALASLRLDPTFDATEAADGFRAALRSASDVEAIFWYGNTLGQWLSYHQMTAIFGGVRDVAASFERSIELDEAYDGAGPHRATASLIAQAHFVIGRPQQEAAAHFERCIELAPDHLEAYVSYAEFYARPTGDTGLFGELISTVLEKAEDPDVMVAYPFYNRLAADRARELAGED